MTHNELYNLLVSTGLPVAYTTFKKPTPPPFVVFLNEGRRCISADDSAWYKVNTYRVELYTDKKEPETEMRLENALDEAGLVYEMDETYIPSEKMYEVAYTIEF